MNDGAVDKNLEEEGSLEEVTNRGEIRSLGSFKEVTNILLEMNQDVAKVILESKKDIWNNPELLGLVEEYFKSSVKTMEFCTALGSCLERAQNSQLEIKQFEEEVEMQDVAGEKKFVKTLEGLQKFKAAGDPFTRQFLDLYESVHEQQVSMLKELHSRKKKLAEKLKCMKTWRRVSNVLFVAAFVTALAGEITVPIGCVRNLCNGLWKRYEKALEEEKGLVTSIEARTFVTIKDMVHIRVLVSKFQVEIESLLDNADFAITEEDVIKTKMAVFMEITEDLAVHAGKCNADIRKASTVILNRILEDADQ